MTCFFRLESYNDLSNDSLKYIEILFDMIQFVFQYQTKWVQRKKRKHVATYYFWRDIQQMDFSDWKFCRI